MNGFFKSVVIYQKLTHHKGFRSSPIHHQRPPEPLQVSIFSVGLDMADDPSLNDKPTY
jgi:hypothetical protein